MNRLLILSLLTNICITGLGQNKLTWKVLDAQTNQPIPGVNVWSKELGKGGWAYYVYRPFESSQKKFLYKEP